LTLIAGGTIGGDGSIKNASGTCLGIKTCSGQSIAVTGMVVNNNIFVITSGMPSLPPITTIVELAEFASFSVASIPFHLSSSSLSP
jgi:hypothetical protein